ncbi:MAG: aromatic ring-hydroxylating dioxygenase subunit alpha, partial [Pseudonocardiaceae bacterium]|nr:aromatic ring-hydroxylating dioxygenase subunit alpha [Pseudonocardiaceae bacterium]
EIGLFGEPKASKRKEGALYFADRGGGTTYRLPVGATFDEAMSYVGYPDEMVETARATWTREQHDLVGKDGFMISAATAFPNLSLVHNWPQVNDDGLIRPFISLRQWQPVSESETEVLSWFAVDANAPDYYKEESYKAYVMCFGSSGMFEQDDVENWVSITSTAKGSMARRLRLNSRMGLAMDGSVISEKPDSFSGPGTVYIGYGEHNQRQLLSIWSDYIEHGDHRLTAPAGKAER